MKMMKWLFGVSLVGALCLDSTATAEKAPLSDGDLQNEAQAIVVATVEEIRIESEPSTFERGFGNSDWGIYLTFGIDSVEKGNVAGQTLEARCFRIKSRRSIQEYLTPSGHHPIPGIGTHVRAYLRKRAGAWHVVLPNGITAHNAGQSPGKSLPDAKQVAELRSLAYTFILPLEAWLLVLLISIPVLVCLGLLRKWKRKTRSITVTKPAEDVTK